MKNIQKLLTAMLKGHEVTVYTNIEFHMPYEIQDKEIVLTGKVSAMYEDECCINVKVKEKIETWDFWYDDIKKIEVVKEGE